MLLKKRVRAGILLYALLMSSIFALLLQFYLGRVLAMERQQQAQLSASQAYLMAEMTQDLAKEPSGVVSFNQGSATYVRKENYLEVTVHLSQGQSYDYHFAETKAEKEEITEKSVESSTEK